MSAMQAIAFTAKERAELVPWPVDDSPLSGDQLMGRTLVTLASPGTELNGYTAERAAPGLSGYAAVVEVEQVGPEVRDLRAGDRVFLMGPHASRQRGSRAGAVPVPESLAPEAAVACRLMGVGWTTLTTTTARPPDPVLVTGLGPVGNLAAQLFQAAGYTVTAVDPLPLRQRLARGVGLRDVRGAVPLDDPALQDKVALAAECSGHEQAALDACRIVRPRGEVVQIGTPWKRQTDRAAHELLHAVFHRYVVLRSGWEWELPIAPRPFAPGSIVGNWAGALAWLAEGRVNVDGLFARRRPDDAQAAWQDLLHRRGDALSVVFDWREGA